jgi:hypothetical protein
LLGEPFSLRIMRLSLCFSHDSPKLKSPVVSIANSNRRGTKRNGRNKAVRQKLIRQVSLERVRDVLTLILKTRRQKPKPRTDLDRKAFGCRRWNTSGNDCWQRAGKGT